MMVRALAFVEGATEEKFIKEIIAPELGAREVFIRATTPGRKRSQGGMQPWARIRRELLRYLKEDTNRFVTTMFDYYGMPTDWPGRGSARRQAHDQKAATVEDAILKDISGAMGDAFDERRFIPYVQMHEFEALLFSDPAILGRVVSEEGIADNLQSIADEFPSPEEIDDGPNTAPSKRILATCKQYQKVLHGNIAAQRIGLARMRQKCRHFAEWLTRLESLGQENET
ncbi:MAG: DUF4276 family protein [Candidatus Eisenbacteria sp.]|nr:DUF4276 family protein [Candidatus Eisenbacteria bacterium]